MQVGIMHATFNGQIGAQYTDFSLTESNTSVVATPGAPPWVVVAPNANLNLDISWNSGVGSDGSLVVVWPATNSLVKEMPANGYTYSRETPLMVRAAASGRGIFCRVSGTATNVTVGNLAANTCLQRRRV